MRATESTEANFNWLVDILLFCNKSTPRMLIFFTKTATLNAVYLYVTHHIGQLSGDTNPLIAMYTKLTSDQCKTHVMTEMSKDSNLRVVLCTSSLSVGVNLTDIKYVIHYGIPTSVSDFLQETGRGAREAGATATSIVIGYPHMVRKGTDKTMKQYARKDLTCCRRVTLLSPFHIIPKFQNECCDICQPAMLSVDLVFSFLRKQFICESNVTSSSSSSASSISLGEEELSHLV